MITSESKRKLEITGDDPKERAYQYKVLHSNVFNEWDVCPPSA
jgi:hypothetical protein